MRSIRTLALVAGVFALAAARATAEPPPSAVSAVLSAPRFEPMSVSAENVVGMIAITAVEIHAPSLALRAEQQALPSIRSTERALLSAAQGAVSSTTATIADTESNASAPPRHSMTRVVASVVIVGAIGCGVYFACKDKGDGNHNGSGGYGGGSAGTDSSRDTRGRQRPADAI